MGLFSVLTYDISGAKRFRIALVGQGPALDAFARIVTMDDFIAAFPKAKIVGWVPTPDDPAETKNAILPEFMRHQKLFTSVQSLFASRRDIQLAIDLSPDARHMASLRAVAPNQVSIGTAEGVLRFCAAAEDGRLAISGGENLRKSQKLFALLVDQVDGDILILDADGKILDCNHHAAKSRQTTRKAIIGRLYQEIEPQETLCSEHQHTCPYQEALTTGKEAEYTFSHLDPDGRMRYFQAMCFPVTDAFGAPSRFLYIRRDITDKHALEQRLQQNEKMAAIGELSTYMAHEIRNPLFSIGGFANSLLRSPELDETAREKARIIYDESRRLDVILKNIVNFARPTDQDMGEFDVADVVRQTLELMTIGSAERGIIVNVDIASDLPQASGNAENLKQCLINLVKNALEAMPDGGTVSVAVEPNEDFVQIAVSDTGKGIPAKDQGMIFSPFFTTKNGGSGLGLAMTRKVITEMGGNVFLHSTPGLGTTVTLQVPVALATSQGSSAAGHAQSSKPKTPGPHSMQDDDHS